MARLKMFSRRDKAAMKKLHDETMPAIVNLKPLNMTPQQEAEKKYPYITGFGDLSDAVNRLQTDQLREAYIEGLQDAPQLSRSVLEEVRERCKQGAIKARFSSEWNAVSKAIDAVNLDDLLPVGDGWVDVSSQPNESGRYWCYVEDMTELGKSYFQWNCYFDKQDNEWRDNHQAMKVTHYRELPKAPNS